MTDYILKAVEEFKEKFDQVEFLHGVPVSMPMDTQNEMLAFLTQSLKHLAKQKDEEFLGRIDNMEKPVQEVGCSGTHDEGQEWNDALDELRNKLQGGKE